jgi:MFS family permease
MIGTMPAHRDRIASPQFLLLWASSFAFYLSFYLLLPALPLYARTLEIPEGQIGLIIGSFAASSMVMKPAAGWSADRWGRKPVLLAGAALFLVSSLLYPWSRSVGALLGVRLLHGAGMGFYPAAGAAMVADLSPPSRRGEAMGFWGAAGSVALALGPVCAIWFVDRWGFDALFRVVVAVALAALVLTAANGETLVTRVAPAVAWGSLLSRAVALPCIVVFCLMTTYGAQIAFLAIYAQSRGANPGVFFLVMAAVIALTRGYAGLVSDRVGRAPVAAAGLVVAATALVVLASGGAMAILAAAGALYGLGLGAAQPVTMAWAADLVTPDERGKALGTFYAAFELGIASGAIGFGAVLARSSFAVMFLSAAAVALIGAALAVSRWKLSFDWKEIS